MGALINIDHDIDVVEAAERRIVNLFSKHKVVCFSTSGGKDSLVCSDVLIRTMQKYQIPFSRLFVVFFDEEAMFDDVIEVARQQRSRFLALGAKFYWFCLPIKHYNCCSLLYDDESFICWEHGKEDVWVRPMPPYAIRNHPSFKAGMTYQVFFKAMVRNIPIITGMRMEESIMRRLALSSTKADAQFVAPIYDWRDNDIWLYIQRYHLPFPETYIRLYKVGVSRPKLRISQFFALDTVKTLPKLLEMDPVLADKVVKREPNAELAFLYWDTPMFRANGQRAKLEEEQKEEAGEVIDYEQKFKEAMLEAPKYPEMYRGYEVVKHLYANLGENHSQKLYKDMLQILVSGDAKKRRYRVLIGDINEEKKKAYKKQNQK